MAQCIWLINKDLKALKTDTAPDFQMPYREVIAPGIERGEIMNCLTMDIRKFKVSSIQTHFLSLKRYNVFFCVGSSQDNLLIFLLESLNLL